MPLFTVLSFRTPKSVENLKIISTNVAPLKETTTHVSMFPNKDTPCGRENEGTREMSRDLLDVVDKKETAFSFVLYKILDIL